MEIFKAQTTGGEVIPDLTLSITEVFPHCESLEENAAAHQSAAKELADKLEASLPGGTLHALLIEMLQRKLDQTLIRWTRTGS